MRAITENRPWPRSKSAKFPDGAGKKKDPRHLAWHSFFCVLTMRIAAIDIPSTLCWSLCITCTILWSPSLAFLPQRNAAAFGVPPNTVLFSTPSSSDGDLMESLRARQLELESQEELRYENWKTAKCESAIRVRLPDWVRRIDLQYPLVACGSASGTIFVAHVETGEILAQGKPQEVEELDDIEGMLRMLFGSYDGGGTLAIAMDGNLICSAGRQGSVQIHRYDTTSDMLISQGSMKALEGVLVTSLQLDEDNLWVGTADGRILAYPVSVDSVLSLQTEPALEVNVGSQVLSFSLEPSIGYGVAATARGSVELFSMEDNNRILCSWYPPFDAGSTRKSSNTFPLTATLVMAKDRSYCMACGASDGSLHLHPLKCENYRLDEDHPLCGNVVECAPKHNGPLKCLISPRPNLLISGGHDGSIRVWDVSDAICLYQFLGEY